MTPTPCKQAVIALAEAALEYIDALPNDVVAALPAMPGFDRDWAEQVLERARHLASQPSSYEAEWRDIETAPKDGTPFLAWEGDERGPFKCWWHDDFPRDESHWTDNQDSEPQPKYWRPMLPKPNPNNFDFRNVLIEGSL